MSIMALVENWREFKQKLLFRAKTKPDGTLRNYFRIFETLLNRLL